MIRELPELLLPPALAVKMAGSGFPEDLLAQFELFRNCLVSAQIGCLEVIQQTPALADHHQQPTTGAVILYVLLEVIGQVINPLG